MADNKENLLKPQAQEEKGEKKPEPIKPLESLVNESSHLVKSGFKLSLAGLVPAIQAYLMPSVARDTAILAGTQIAGDATTNFKRGKKTTAGEILKSATIGTLIAAPANLVYKYINQIPLDSLAGYLGRAAAFGGAVVPLFTGFYQSVDYFVRNLTFKGMGKYLKENYWPTLKKFWKRIYLFSLANLYFVTSNWQIPIAAGLQYLFTLFGAPKKDKLKEEEKRDTTPYSAAIKNVGYKIFNAPYDIGRAIYEGAKQLPKKMPQAPQPQPAGARA